MAREVPITQKQVPINARVQVTGGPQGPAAVSRDVASKLRQNRDNYQAQAIENAYLRGTINLTTQMDQLEKQYENDPDGLQTAIDDYSEGFLSEVSDPEMQARFELQLLTASQSAVARATKKRNALIDDQAKFDNLTAYQAIQDNIGNVVKSLASPDLGERTAAARQLQELQNRGATILTATAADGTPLFGPEYRAEQLYNLKEKSLLDYMDAYFQNAPDKEAALKEFEKGNIFIQLPNAGESTAKTGNRLMTDLQNELGISKEAAAGIVGNLAYESGGFMQLQEIAPMIPGSRGGFGFAQWTGPRREAFERWAAEQGLDPKSYEANKGFLIHELKNTPEGAVLNDLKGAKDQLEAAKVFSDKFLRPGIKNMGSRLAWAQALYNGQDGVDLVNVTDSVGQKTRDLIKKTGEAYIEQYNKDLLDAQEAPLRDQIMVENELLPWLQDPATPLTEKLAKINQLDFNGQIRDEFASGARQYVSSLKPSPESVPVQEKYQAFNTLSQELGEVRVKFGGSADKIDTVKLSQEGMKAYQQFQSNVMAELNASRITEKEAQQLLGGVQQAITVAIQDKNTKATGLTILPGIQDPYYEGIKSIDRYLENQGRPDAIVEKKQLFELFTEYLGGFDDKGNYQPTGEYKSTGSKAQDEKVIQQALRMAREAMNRQNFVGVVDTASLPNQVVRPVQSAPKAGDVVDGYRFKGGDPADQKNWEPA